MLNKIKTVLIFILIAVSAFYVIQYKNLNTSIIKLKEENGTLDEKYKALVKIKGSKVEYIYRDKDRIVTVIKYLPPEGSAQINTNSDGSQTVDIQNKGFTFKPQIAVGYHGVIDPQLAARLVYWDRYGAGIGLGVSGVNIFADRRISDFVPFMDNTTLGIYTNFKGVGLKISTFF